MKILAFTDMHGSKTALRRLRIKAKKADYVLCCGDFTIFGRSINTYLREFNRIKKPFIFVHGNHEDEGEIRATVKKLDHHLYFIHERYFEDKNILVLGYGGGGFSYTEPKLKVLARKWKPVIKKARKEKKKIIFITHAPPYRTALDKIMKNDCGNRTIEWFIKKFKVDYAFSGHLHENSGRKDKIKETLVMNPGPFGELIEIK